MLGIKKLKQDIEVLEHNLELLKDAQLSQIELNLFLLDAIEALSLNALESSKPKAKKPRVRKK